MAKKIEYVEVARAELKVDIYTGPNCDQHAKLWHVHFDGDRESADVSGDLPISIAQFPPGTRVSITVPVCPECHMDAEMCAESSGCSFDWKAWAEEKYS